MLGKGVTVKQIEKYLDRRGWNKYQSIEEPGEKEGATLTGWRSPGGEGYTMLIDPLVEKKCLTFRVAKILHAKPDSTPSDRLSGLLMTMSFLNYQLILGAWVYDPSDGEVAFKVGIPIDDDELSFETFEHCMRVLIAAVEVDADNLRAIVSGAKSAVDVLRAEGAKI